MDDKDKKFVDGLEGNLNEIKAEEAAGAKIEDQLEQKEAQAVAQETVEQQMTRETVAAGSDFLTAEEEKAMAEPKKGINVGLVLVITVVVLALAAVAGYAGAQLLKRDKGGNNASSGMVEDDEAGETTPPETEIEELSVDDEVVKRLWGQFNTKIIGPENMPDHVGLMSSFEPLNEFYTVNGALSVDGLSDKYKFAIALQSLDDYSGESTSLCRGNYDHLHWVDEQGVDHPSTEMKLCLSGDTVRSKVEEIFGDPILLDQFDGWSMMVAGEGWLYSLENDEAVPLASGATFRPIIRALIEAEQDDDNIYIYEVVGYVGCWIAGQEACSASRLDGSLIPGGENINVENIRDYADQFDTFKWTFTKNEAGNYVFAGLERL